MAILHSDEANILDAETVNWRLVVYPILAVLIIGVGGFAYYLYQQSEREQLETDARAALIDAKTPAELIAVADKFPKADQATIALLSAADGSFTKRDFASAISDYQRILNDPAADPELSESAQLGVASAQEANGKADDAITSYLVVAQRGAKSPFAPYAYTAVAHIYEQRKDVDNERKTLTEMASLDPDSPFVKQAQYKLKQMAPPTPPPAPMPATAPAPSVSAPAPIAATPTPATPAPAVPAQK